MVDPRKLLLLAATINSRTDHLTPVQEKILRDKSLVKKAMKEIQERARAEKPHISVPELEKLANSK